MNAEGATEEGQIRISKQLYNGVMSWDANDFGSIIRNQGYFQRGIIHNIVDETDFKWKVDEEKDEQLSLEACADNEVVEANKDTSLDRLVEESQKEETEE